MKKFLIFLALIFLNINTSFAFQTGEEYVVLPKGSFLRATMQREISTATNKVGDEVRMIATSPTFAGNGVVVPKNSVYIGEILEINQPIEGCNASLRIQINKIIFPDGEEMIIDAMLWSKNKNLFGGELTMPAYYNKVPHFTFGWKGGCLAFQNSGIYKMGVPTVIKAGAELLIVLEEDIDFNLYEL